MIFISEDAEVDWTPPAGSGAGLLSYQARVPDSRVLRGALAQPVEAASAACEADSMSGLETPVRLLQRKEPFSASALTQQSSQGLPESFSPSGQFVDDLETQPDLRPRLLVFPADGPMDGYHGLATEDEAGVLQASKGPLPPGTVPEPEEADLQLDEASDSFEADPEPRQGPDSEEAAKDAKPEDSKREEAAAAKDAKHEEAALVQEEPGPKSRKLSHKSAEAEFLAKATRSELQQLEKAYPSGSRITPDMTPRKVLKLKAMRVLRKRQISIEWHKNFESKGVQKGTATSEPKSTSPEAESKKAKAEPKSKSKDKPSPEADSKKAKAKPKSKSSDKLSPKAKSKKAEVIASNMRTAKDPACESM